MMGVDRITARFDLGDADEARAAEYLKSLKRGEVNRFIVAAVLVRLDGGEKLVEQIRQMLREEIKAAPVVAIVTPSEQNAHRHDVTVTP